MREERSEFLAAASVQLVVALTNMGIKQKEQIRARTEGLWGRNSEPEVATAHQDREVRKWVCSRE